MKTSPLLSIFLIVLVDVLGLTIILPLLPFYAESFGATPAVVGMLVSAYAICQLIAGPPLGHLSDRVGRRPVLLVSQMGTCAGFLILASAHALWTEGHLTPDAPARFYTKSGLLTCTREGDWIRMDFPAKLEQRADPPAQLAEALATAGLLVKGGH